MAFVLYTLLGVLCWALWFWLLTYLSERYVRYSEGTRSIFRGCAIFPPGVIMVLLMLVIYLSGSYLMESAERCAREVKEKRLK